MKLIIENFKSIKYAELELKPITVFIGKPDSGKSNTIEALGLISYVTYGGPFAIYFRSQTLSSLMYAFTYSKGSISLVYDDLSINIKFRYESYGVQASLNLSSEVRTAKRKTSFSVTLYEDGDAGWSIPSIKDNFELTNLLRIRFYRYWFQHISNQRLSEGGFILEKLKEEFRDAELEKLEKHILLPPFGQNFHVLIRENEISRHIVNEIAEEL